VKLVLSRFWLGAVAVIGLGVSATPAKAAFTATFDAVSQHSTTGGQTAGVFNWHTSGTVAGVAYSAYPTNYGGLSSGSISTQYSNHFAAFCIQHSNPPEYVSYGGTYTYQVVALDLAPDVAPGNMTLAQANQIQRMWTYMKADGGVVTAGTADATKSAAFQWAIWTILGQDTYDNSDAAIALQIGTYVAESTDTTNALANLRGLTNDTAQDMVFELLDGYTDEGGDISAVPAPAGMALLASALPFLMVRRAFRRRMAAGA
jgi:hypothetical protein